MYLRAKEAARCHSSVENEATPRANREVEKAVEANKSIVLVAVLHLFCITSSTSLIVPC